jgi:hypothetical protein
MAMSDGGEIIQESRGLTSGRAAQASPYHDLEASVSRFADRNLGGDVRRCRGAEDGDSD